MSNMKAMANGSVGETVSMKNNQENSRSTVHNVQACFESHQ